MNNKPNVPLNLWCKVGQSPIHQFGMFAFKFIPKGTKISYYTGDEMSWTDFKTKYGNDWRYCYRRMPWLPLIVSKDKKNLINFVNDGHYGQTRGHHNCVLKSRWLIAIEDIEIGQELLLKYHDSYFKSLPKV